MTEQQDNSMKKATGGVVKPPLPYIIGDSDDDSPLDMALMSFNGQLPENVSIEELKQILLDSIRTNYKSSTNIDI